MSLDLPVIVCEVGGSRYGTTSYSWMVEDHEEGPIILSYGWSLQRVLDGFEDSRDYRDLFVTMPLSLVKEQSAGSFVEGCETKEILEWLNDKLSRAVRSANPANPANFGKYPFEEPEEGVEVASSVIQSKERGTEYVMFHVRGVHPHQTTMPEALWIQHIMQVTINTVLNQIWSPDMIVNPNDPPEFGPPLDTGSLDQGYRGMPTYVRHLLSDDEDTRNAARYRAMEDLYNGKPMPPEYALTIAAHLIRGSVNDVVEKYGFPVLLILTVLALAVWT